MKAEERVEKAVIRIVLDSPLFAHLIGRLKLHVVEGSAPALGLEGRDTLYLFKRNLEKMGEEHLLAVLLEQVLHMALRHPDRARGKKDPLAWKVACDLAVLQLLADLALERMLRGKAAPAVPDVAELCRRMARDLGVADFSPERMTEEEMYRILEGRVGALSLPVSAFGSDTHEGWGRADPASEAAFALEMEELLATATALQENIPLGAARRIRRFMQPVLPWQHVVSSFLRRAREEYTWDVPDRRRMHRGEYFWPSLAAPSSLRAAVAVDTSGSVREDQLGAFLDELLSLTSSLRAEVLLLACDAAVHEERIVSWREGYEPEEIARYLVGGGGTNYLPVFQRLQETGRRPDVLVYFTDGLADFPSDPPDFPVVWAICPPGGTVEEYLQTAERIAVGSAVYVPRREG